MAKDGPELTFEEYKARIPTKPPKYFVKTDEPVVLKAPLTVGTHLAVLFFQGR